MMEAASFGQGPGPEQLRTTRDAERLLHLRLSDFPNDRIDNIMMEIKYLVENDRC